MNSREYEVIPSQIVHTVNQRSTCILIKHKIPANGLTHLIRLDTHITVAVWELKYEKQRSLPMKPAKTSAAQFIHHIWTMTTHYDLFEYAWGEISIRKKNGLNCLTSEGESKLGTWPLRLILVKTVLHLPGTDVHWVVFSAGTHWMIPSQCLPLSKPKTQGESPSLEPQACFPTLMVMFLGGGPPSLPQFYSHWEQTDHRREGGMNVSLHKDNTMNNC